MFKIKLGFIPQKDNYLLQSLPNLEVETVPSLESENIVLGNNSIEFIISLDNFLLPYTK